jgi:hypothetical protein
VPGAVVLIDRLDMAIIGTSGRFLKQEAKFWHALAAGYSAVSSWLSA